MSRSVNKTQSDVLLNKMQNNREIACGFIKIPKDVVASFWRSLTEELNSDGPPMKSVSEWKKVWVDQKRYVRAKAASNLKNQRGTGGGPNETKNFSPTEQCIYDLVGMKESVEGLEHSLSFGLPECYRINKKKDTPESTETDLPPNIENEVCPEVASCSNIVTPTAKDAILNENSSGNKSFPLKRKQVEPEEKLSTADLIARKLKTQKDFFSKIAEIGQSIQIHNKEIEIMMKRVYRALEKNNDLKSKSLIELERHHAVMEELRTKEVENKIYKSNKMLEIETLKIKILQKNNTAENK